MRKFPVTFLLFFIFPVLRWFFEVSSTINLGGTLTTLHYISITQLILILIMFILLWRGMNWPKYVISLIVILSQVLFITPPLLIPLPEVKFFRTLTRFIFVMFGYIEFFMPGEQAKAIEDVPSDESA